MGERTKVKKDGMKEESTKGRKDKWQKMPTRIKATLARYQEHRHK